ncbi:MAG: hypothetical protein WCL10_18780 [Novosphingobium sp.]|uniref:hypothetical protein n=1 Tax=Novosphingobium sp. TaxID=1874826 RepID=UPI00301AC8AC
MPTYAIKAPNGKTYHIDGPAGATDEQVRAEVLRQFPDADPYQGRAESDIVGELHPAAPAKAKPAPKPAPRTWAGDLLGATQNTLGGLVKGAAGLPDAVTNAIGAAAGYVVQGGGHAAGYVADQVTGGPTLTNIVTGKKTLGQQIREGADYYARQLQHPVTIGGAVEAVAPTPQDGTGRTVRALSEFAGGMVSPVNKFLPSGSVKPKANITAADVESQFLSPKIGTPAPTTISSVTGRGVAREGSGIAALGRKAVVRDARLRAAGVSNPTVGMVTRDPRAWNFERESSKLHGSGDQMLGAIKEVESDLATAARTLVDKQGGNIGAEATGQGVSKVLAEKSAQLNQQVSALYTRVRDKFGNVRVPTLENLKQAQAHPDWADNAEFDDMAAAINKRLARYADADGGLQGLSVNQAEELRKFVGGLGKDSKQTYAMRRIFQNALDSDVIDTVGGAPFASARAAAAKRFDEFSKTFAGKVAAGDVTPELLTDRLLSRATSLSDLRAMRGSLLVGKQAAQGKEALNAVGGHALDTMFSKGISPDGKVNGTQIYKQFEQLAPRLQIILGPARYKEVRRLALAARDATAEVPFSAVNNSNTASAAANMFPEIAANGNKLLPNLARRVGSAVAGGIGGGPIGAIAGDATAQAANEMIGKRALAEVAKQAKAQVDIARDPQAAADFIRTLSNRADVDPIVRQFAIKLREKLAIGARNGGALPISQAISKRLNDNVASAAVASDGKEQQQQQQ